MLPLLDSAERKISQL
jgi:hypothetical protein